ncbi:MAG: hypothetical protein LBD55_00270 [Treponema sp.]|jgi:uncharacterized protein involved in response to NO|nr:hypothetical protein [Treponema sp.]
MIQFYFLSVLCNALAGYMLISTDEKSGIGAMEAHLKISPGDDTFRLVLGIVAIITGFFKLLSVIQGDIPVVGDLIPAVFGFASGSILVFAYYRKTSTIDSDTHTLLELFLAYHKKRIGFLAIGAAILHFLFPQALLI